MDYNLSLQVIFLQIRSNQEKLKKIFLTAKKHFENSHHLLFLTQDRPAADYLDEFLWEEPLCFIPHKVLLSPQEELIAITPIEQNLNQSKNIFNLRKEPIHWEDPHVRIIYELQDVQKKSEIKEKISFYQKLGCRISSI